MALVDGNPVGPDLRAGRSCEVERAARPEVEPYLAAGLAPVSFAKPGSSAAMMAEAPLVETHPLSKSEPSRRERTTLSMGVPENYRDVAPSQIRQQRQIEFPVAMEENACSIP